MVKLTPPQTTWFPIGNHLGSDLPSGYHPKTGITQGWLNVITQHTSDIRRVHHTRPEGLNEKK